MSSLLKSGFHQALFYKAITVYGNHVFGLQPSPPPRKTFCARTARNYLFLRSLKQTQSRWKMFFSRTIKNVDSGTEPSCDWR